MDSETEESTRVHSHRANTVTDDDSSCCSSSDSESDDDHVPVGQDPTDTSDKKLTLIDDEDSGLVLNIPPEHDGKHLDYINNHLKL